MSKFSTRLKEERNNLHLTQKEMAERLGIPLRTYINYEQKGKSSRQPDFDTLVEIAKILGTSTDYLLGLQD